MNIIKTSVSQPVFIAMLMIALVVVGLIGYSRLPVDLMPDVSVPVISVSTVYPGASPAEVQREISQPLEEALGSLNGVKNVNSTSSENVSIVTIEFNLEHSIQRASDDVRERVAVARGAFPSAAQDPIIQRFDFSVAPILTLGITDKTSQLTPAQLRTLVVDTLKPRLERVDGVADIGVTGGQQREIQVLLNLDEMKTRRVTPQQVVAAIKSENLSLPGGRVNEGGQDMLVRTPGDFKTVGEMGELTITTLRGVPTYLKDIATIKDGFAEVNTYSRIDGKDSVSVSIRKQSGTNTVAIAEGVKKELEKIAHDYPDLTVTIVSDQSEFIEASIEDSLVDLILGGVFASLVVLFFFRDIRNTLVTVAGLPVIMIGTFAVLSALNISLNMITLLALSLAVGLVIDDAIVVRENIFRHMERGKHPKEASLDGTNEVSLSVLAMTLTVVSVFLPVAFTSGLIGKIFREFGITIVVAVLISLVEAFTLAPMLSAYLFKQRQAKPGHETEEGAATTLGWLDRQYRGILAWALGHKKISALIGLLVFVLIIASASFVEMAFLPNIDSGTFIGGLQLAPGTPLAQTDQQARQIEAALLSIPEVENVFTSVGGSSTSERATFTIKMHESGKIKMIEPAVREKLGNIKGLNFNFNTSAAGGGGGTGASSRDIQIQLKSTGTFETLDAASLQVMQAIADVPGLVDVDRSYQAGKPELHVDVDRQRAARVGLSTATVGATVRTLINGETASRFREAGREADIVVRLREQDRSRLDDILQLSIPSTTGALVPLRNVATVSNSSGPASITRQNRQPRVVIGGNYAGRSQQAVTQDITKRLAQMQLPAGITYSFGGQQQQMAESFSSLLFSLMLSVIFVYMVLASQFGSFTQPIVLMLALPLSIIGAFLGLVLARFPFDMTAMIGIILLMGLVTKNSILLVDFANRLRAQGKARDEALLIAGPIRLRPILMTTLSLILGMLPVALGLGAGGSFRAPMAVAVIGGLITSTLLTLILVPVAYSIMDIVLGWRGRKTQAATAPAPAGE